MCVSRDRYSELLIYTYKLTLQCFYLGHFKDHLFYKTGYRKTSTGSSWPSQQNWRAKQGGQQFCIFIMTATVIYFTTKGEQARMGRQPCWKIMILLYVIFMTCGISVWTKMVMVSGSNFLLKCTWLWVGHPKFMGFKVALLWHSQGCLLRSLWLILCANHFLSSMLEGFMCGPYIFNTINALLKLTNGFKFQIISSLMYSRGVHFSCHDCNSALLFRELIINIDEMVAHKFNHRLLFKENVIFCM